MKRLLLPLLFLSIALVYGSPFGMYMGRTILNKANVKLENVGLEFTTMKVLDPASGKIEEIVLDKSGREISKETFNSYLEEEKRLNEEKHGKIEPTLNEILKEVPDDEPIRVAIWFKAPDLSDLDFRRPGITKDERRVLLDEAIKRHSEKARSILSALSSLGYEGIPAEGVPFVSAWLPKSAIKEIAKHPDVVAIYYAPKGEREINYATTTERASFVWLRGITGYPHEFAVHEDDGVSSSNPFLSNSTHDVVYFRSDGPVGSHATAVAGIVTSTHSIDRGMAPEAEHILSANFVSFDSSLAYYNSAVIWAINNGADAINMSWGGNYSGAMSVYDRWVDYLIKTYAILIVKSAGNNNSYITAPGNGYNILTVGAINDQDNAFWSDDHLYAYSNWINPPSPHNDREKPEVVAVGEDIVSTTTSYPWVGSVGSGTSYAAPAVTGLALLLQDRASDLNYWPEAQKAIIMASAFHNILGNEIPYSSTDEKDGCGAIVAAIADSVALNGWYVKKFVTPDSFPGNYMTLSNVIPAVVGDTWRVVLVWDANASSDYSTDTLNADLDLIIYDPNGSPVTASSRYDNSFEVCQFVANMTGNYTIKIHSFRFDPGTNTYMAVAWARKVDTGPCSHVVEVFNGDTVHGNTLNGSMFWDSYNISSWNESGRELVYKIYIPYDSMALTVSLLNMTNDLDLFVLTDCDNNSAVAYGDVSAYYTGPAGTYYIVVDGYYGAVGEFDLAVTLSGQPNLKHYLYSGWTYPVVPRDSNNTTVNYCPLPAELPGNDTVWLNTIGKNVGNDTTDTAFYHYFYVDGVNVGGATWTARVPPDWGFIHPNYPVIIKGGRHTIGDSIDPQNYIPESNEDDNYYERQFVFKPLTIYKDVPVTRSEPPTYGNGVYPNSDGFEFTRSGNFAYGIAMASVTSDEDYDLRLYADYSGSESGFSVLLKGSYYGTNATELIIAAYQGVQSTVFPAVTKYSGGNDNFVINATDSQGRLLGAPPSSVIGETLASHILLHVYEVYLFGGKTYNFTLINYNSSAQVEFALYGPDSGYYRRSEFLAFGLSPVGGNAHFTYAPSDSGWYVLAVFKPVCDMEDLEITYDLYISESFVCGDVNGDGTITSDDFVYLGNYLFFGGPAPMPYLSGDVNNDCTITSDDFVYLGNYLFFGGPAPSGCCTSLLITREETKTKEIR